jgi:hypothetical protein
MASAPAPTTAAGTTATTPEPTPSVEEASESPTTVSWAENFGGKAEGYADDTDGQTDTRGDGWPEGTSSSDALSESSNNGGSSSTSTGGGSTALIGTIIIVVFAIVTLTCCWGTVLVIMRRRKVEERVDDTASSVGDDDSSNTTQSPCPSDAGISDAEPSGSSARLKNAKRMNSWNTILQLSLKTIEEEPTKSVGPKGDTPKGVPDSCSDVENDEMESGSDELRLRGLPMTESGSIIQDATQNIKEADQSEPDAGNVAPRDISDGVDSTATPRGCPLEPIAETPEGEAWHERDEQPDRGKPALGGESDGYETESVCSEDLEYMYGTLPMDKLPSTPKTRNTKTAKRSPDSVVLDESSRSLLFLSITPHDGDSFSAKERWAAKSNTSIHVEPEDEEVEDEAGALSWV